MWHGIARPIDLVSSDFSDWMRANEDELSFLERGNSALPRQQFTLLDLLEFWLQRGEGFSSCATFEAFLLITIGIIDDRICSGELVSSDDPSLPKRGMTFPLPLFWAGDDDPRYGDGRFNHRILDREYFQYLQLQWSNERQHSISQRLSQITTILAETRN
jgi:hypothetical protein